MSVSKSEATPFAFALIVRQARMLVAGFSNKGLHYSVFVTGHKIELEKMEDAETGTVRHKVIATYRRKIVPCGSDNFDLSNGRGKQ